VADFNTGLTSASSTTISGALLPSAARTTAVSDIIPDENISNCVGLYVWLVVTAASGTGGLQLAVKAVPPNATTGGVLLHTLPTAVIATGATSLLIYPGATAGATTVSSAAIPPRISFGVVVGDASSYTYAVHAYQIL
jgi:hypothetical protein